MTTRTTTIACRPMRATDLPAAHALSQAVHWPHRREDWQFALRLGPGFVAEEDGAVVGTALCWHQGPRHGSLGLIIVSPAHQGKGIGRQLMRLVLDHLGDRCTLLNATKAGQPLYESLGFQAIGTLRQHQGIFTPPQASAGPRTRPAGAADIPAIVALANRGTGMVRDEVIKQLVGVADGAVLEQDGAVTGFSLIRPFGRGHVIGPVVAADAACAQALIATWGDAYAGAFVRIDVTGSSGLGEWLAQAGLAEVDTAVTMARNGVPASDDTVRQVAIVSQALC